MEYCLKFIVDQKLKIEVLDFIEDYSQVSWFKKNDDWVFDLILTNKQKLINLKEQLLMKFEIENVQLISLPEQDWVKVNQKNENMITSNLFAISQYNNNLSINKKFFLCIPASNSFGTGQHITTRLCIEEIEFLLKKICFSNILDIGTGSGILSLVIGKLTNKKINSSDLDSATKINILANMQINNYKKISLVICKDLVSNYFRGKKFDLIVSNILLNPLKNLAKPISKHIHNGGYLILSGILQSQLITLYKYYYNFNFKLVKKRIVDGWAIVILRKNGKES